MMFSMIRTQIQLEEKQYEAIRRLAHKHRISMSEAVRRLVTAGLAAGRNPIQQPSGARALLALAGIGKSGLGDLGRRHDDYLAEDFG